MPKAPKKPKEEPKPWLIDIGRRLRLARNATGISQVVAAKAVKMTSAAWSQWERALRPPDIRALAWLSKTYHVPAGWVLTGEATETWDLQIAQKVLPDGELFRLQSRDRFRK